MNNMTVAVLTLICKKIFTLIQRRGTKKGDKKDGHTNLTIALIHKTELR